MSKFTEYLKLVPQGLPNSREILESIVANVQLKMGNLPEDKKEEIIRRRLICAACPFMSKNAQNSLEYRYLTGKSYVTKRRDDHCTFCGCEIKMRTGSLSSDCGIAVWNKNNPENTIPLKWTKLEVDGE